MKRKLFSSCIFLLMSAASLADQAPQAATVQTNAAPAAAKGDAFPSDAAISAQMDRDRPYLKSVVDAVGPEDMHSKMPTIPGIPSAKDLDIAKIAQRYEKRAKAKRMDDLLVFVSFSMPEESLKRVIKDVTKLGGSVVLNGFKDNSIPSTAIAIRDLSDAIGNVIVNPVAFTKYHVSAVPTVVLVKAEALNEVDLNGCALPDAYAAATGDVTLRYSLEQIGQHNSNFSEMATRYGRQLGGDE